MQLHIAAAPSELDRTVPRRRLTIRETDGFRQRLDADMLAGFLSQQSIKELFPDGHGLPIRFSDTEAEIFIPSGMTAEYDGRTVSAEWIAVTPKGNDWPHQLRFGGLWLDLMVTL